jgi:hypothetical protein
MDLGVRNNITARMQNTGFQSTVPILRVVVDPGDMKGLKQTGTQQVL